MHVKSNHRTIHEIHYGYVGIDRGWLRSRFCHHRFRISCGESGFAKVHAFSHFSTEAKGRRMFD